MGIIMIIFGHFLEFVSYLAVMVLHELAHSEVARHKGYCLSRISLMPYGASLTGAFELVKTRDEMAIAIAGPIFNIVLAVICICFWWLFPSSYFYTFNFVLANMCTAIFNLVPIFPLDGGRVLLALLSKNNTRQNAYKKMRVVGFVGAGVFTLAFVVSLFFSVNLSVGCIAIFIFASTIFPDKGSQYQRLYGIAYRSSMLKKGLSIREVVVSGDSSIMSLLKMLNTQYFYKFEIVDDTFKKIGKITELELENISINFNVNTSIKSVICIK